MFAVRNGEAERRVINVLLAADSEQKADVSMMDPDK